MEMVLNAYRNLSVTDMDEEDATALNSSGAQSYDKYLTISC